MPDRNKTLYMYKNCSDRAELKIKTATVIGNK